MKLLTTHHSRRSVWRVAFATGLLVLCVGKATRLQNYLMGMEKTYEGTIQFGWATDSYDSAGEVIGVLAHETGHIAGGHLSKLRQELANQQTAAIIAMLAGIGAMVAGARGGQGSGDIGAAAIMAPQSAIQRSLLAYVRAQEDQADHAAVKFLNAIGQSPRGWNSVQVACMNWCASIAAVSPGVVPRGWRRSTIFLSRSNVRSASTRKGKWSRPSCRRNLPPARPICSSIFRSVRPRKYAT